MPIMEKQLFNKLSTCYESIQAFLKEPTTRAKKITRGGFKYCYLLDY